MVHFMLVVKESAVELIIGLFPLTFFCGGFSLNNSIT